MTVNQVSDVGVILLIALGGLSAVSIMAAVIVGLHLGATEPVGATAVFLGLAGAAFYGMLAGASR